jgi:hypothetical protein
MERGAFREGTLRGSMLGETVMTGEMRTTCAATVTATNTNTNMHMAIRIMTIGRGVARDVGGDGLVPMLMREYRSQDQVEQLGHRKAWI